MTPRPDRRFARGETIFLQLAAYEGDAGLVSSVMAHMRKMEPGRSFLIASAPKAAEFAIEDRATSGAVPAGWNLTVSAGQSAALSAGYYLADALFTVAGRVEAQPPLVIEIYEPATLA